MTHCEFTILLLQLVHQRSPCSLGIARSSSQVFAVSNLVRLEVGLEEVKACQDGLLEG